MTVQMTSGMVSGFRFGSAAAQTKQTGIPPGAADLQDTASNSAMVATPAATSTARPKSRLFRFLTSPFRSAKAILTDRKALTAYGGWAGLSTILGMSFGTPVGLGIGAIGLTSFALATLFKANGVQ